MKNRKYNLLPYETIVKAAAGEPEAVNAYGHLVRPAGP